MRFDQCSVDCTTDCGHCKGDPIGAMREEIARLARQISAIRDASEERSRQLWRSAFGIP